MAYGGILIDSLVRSSRLAGIVATHGRERTGAEIRRRLNHHVGNGLWEPGHRQGRVCARIQRSIATSGYILSLAPFDDSSFRKIVFFNVCIKNAPSCARNGGAGGGSLVGLGASGHALPFFGYARARHFSIKPALLERTDRKGAG